MEPLRINWRLVTPMVVAERPMHLDSILAFARVAAGRASGVEPASVLELQNDLPLETAAIGNEWVWKASQLHFHPDDQASLVPMTRRTDLQEMAYQRGRVFETRMNKPSLGTGQFRAYDLRIAVQWISLVEAFAVGDMAVIRQLLANVTHLGKVRRNGWGKIASWNITADQVAEDRWQERTMPSSYSGSTHVDSYGGLRPPYWDRRHWQPVKDFIG